MKKNFCFITIIFISLFSIFYVSAKSNDLELLDVEIIEKSDAVRAFIKNGNVSNINLDTLFFGKDDYIKYKVVIKNSSNNSIKINDISDNLNNDVLETSYDIENDKIDSSKKSTFTLTIKCIKNIDEEKITLNSPLNIIINYDDGKTVNINTNTSDSNITNINNNINDSKVVNMNINPNTNDGFIVYFVIFLLSTILLFILLNKYWFKIFLCLIIIVNFIPIPSNALVIKNVINVNCNITIYGKIATIESSLLANKKLKDISGVDTSQSDDISSITNSFVKKIVKSESLPANFNITENNIISSDNSKLPVYCWLDGDILYYYSDSNKILLNEDSSYLFSNFTELEEIDLSFFDTSNVENMSGLFYTCSKLNNLDLSNFDTSNVKNMSYMFRNCRNHLTLDVSSFDTSNVEDMKYMFTNCTNLNELDITNFDTSKVVDFDSTFRGCSGLTNIDLSNFSIESSVITRGMFYDCINLIELDLSNFYTENEVDMSWMFRGCEKLERVLFNTSKTIKLSDINHMFCMCYKIDNIDLSSFDTSKVQDMRMVFYKCNNLKNINLSRFDTSSANSLQAMFYECENLEEINMQSFITTNVTDLGWLFYGCKKLSKVDFGDFDTSNVTNMKSMFYNCLKINELDLSSFNTSNVEDMSYMFCYDSELKKIYVSDGFVTDNISSSGSMFYKNNNLVGGNGTLFDSSKIDKTYARVDDINKPGYFTLKSD